MGTFATTRVALPAGKELVAAGVQSTNLACGSNSKPVKHVCVQATIGTATWRQLAPAAAFGTTGDHAVLWEATLYGTQQCHASQLRPAQVTVAKRPKAATSV
jgi:hypothetical protein